MTNGNFSPVPHLILESAVAPEEKITVDRYMSLLGELSV
jgi:hypothetical protein